jgi:hypothetical protein
LLSLLGDERELACKLPTRRALHLPPPLPVARTISAGSDGAAAAAGCPLSSVKSMSSSLAACISCSVLSVLALAPCTRMQKMLMADLHAPHA